MKAPRHGHNMAATVHTSTHEMTEWNGGSKAFTLQESLHLQRNILTHTHQKIKQTPSRVSFIYYWAKQDPRLPLDQSTGDREWTAMTSLDRQKFIPWDWDKDLPSLKSKVLPESAIPFMSTK